MVNELLLSVWATRLKSDRVLEWSGVRYKVSFAHPLIRGL